MQVTFVTEDEIADRGNKLTRYEVEVIPRPGDYVTQSAWDPSRAQYRKVITVLWDFDLVKPDDGRPGNEAFQGVTVVLSRFRYRAEELPVLTEKVRG